MIRLLSLEPQAFEVGHQLQVLLAGQQLVDRGELAGDADRRANRLGPGGDVVPGDGGRSAVGRHQGGQHVHGRRLAGPVRTEQGEDRSFADLQVDAVEDHLVPEGLPQPGGRNRCFCHVMTIEPAAATLLTRP